MDDLISRQAAIRWVKTECNPFGMPTLDFESGKKVIDHLDQMPSAQSEPKRGKWIPRERKYHCSRCDGVAPKGMTWNWCPHCGADMRTAKQIVHDAIDNTPMAEDAFPGIKERLHKAVDEMREVTE